MHAVAQRFELFIPESHSLKQKRAVLRPIVDGLRLRMHVSVAEVDHQDTWQRAAIAVALVAPTDGRLREVMATVERHVAHSPGIELLDVETAWLDAESATLGPDLGADLAAQGGD
jgi:uncharacterized protein YlxP (DUF503 family)